MNEYICVGALTATASKRKQFEQETLAWRTSRPSSSKASNTNTSKPRQLLSVNTLITKPLSKASTPTCTCPYTHTNTYIII